MAATGLGSARLQEASDVLADITEKVHDLSISELDAIRVVRQIISEVDATQRAMTSDG